MLVESISYFSDPEWKKYSELYRTISDYIGIRLKDLRLKCVFGLAQIHLDFWEPLL